MVLGLVLLVLVVLVLVVLVLAMVVEPSMVRFAHPPTRLPTRRLISVSCSFLIIPSGVLYSVSRPSSSCGMNLGG